MDHGEFQMLGLAGSLRRDSVHRGILRAAHEVGPGWMSCESFDLGRIPYFNQDVEDEGTPEPVRELRKKTRAADAVLVATPEYDYAIPGVLTAALDWALRSRYDPTPFRHEAVGIVGASPGGAGTARGQMVLRQKFDQETGDLTDQETRRRLRRLLEALVEWSERAGRPAAYERTL
jgi:chromate reductase, NAD(P)H dehydrogenase (quinone)